eukprot:361497-Chlamydomonas_euryale.AAC.6
MEVKRACAQAAALGWKRLGLPGREAGRPRAAPLPDSLPVPWATRDHIPALPQGGEKAARRGAP